MATTPTGDKPEVKYNPLFIEKQKWVEGKKYSEDAKTKRLSQEIIKETGTQGTTPKKMEETGKAVSLSGLKKFRSKIYNLAARTFYYIKTHSPFGTPPLYKAHFTKSKLAAKNLSENLQGIKHKNEQDKMYGPLPHQFGREVGASNLLITMISPKGSEIAHDNNTQEAFQKAKDENDRTELNSVYQNVDDTMKKHLEDNDDLTMNVQNLMTQASLSDHVVHLNNLKGTVLGDLGDSYPVGGGTYFALPKYYTVEVKDDGKVHVTVRYALALNEVQENGWKSKAYVAIKREMIVEKEELSKEIKQVGKDGFDENITPSLTVTDTYSRLAPAPEQNPEVKGMELVKQLIEELDAPYIKRENYPTEGDQS